MSPDDRAEQDDSDQTDAVAIIETGRQGQKLICEGWFASHADSGTPGPHVHIRTSDGATPVLRTDQLPALTTALTQVAERIEAMWTASGDQYTSDVVLRAPDPQDPAVVEQQRLGRLRFTQRVADNLPEVVRLLTEATSTDEAFINIAAMLGADEGEVMVGLAQFDLLTLTRPATQRRLQTLGEPNH